ncbi:hypothetical protein GJ496_003207 [Pomphorhynchus laevis]|nr:hypothetical protein GJ496_003207 [Pomphorhynchus laevis]
MEKCIPTKIVPNRESVDVDVEEFGEPNLSNEQLEQIIAENKDDDTYIHMHTIEPSTWFTNLLLLPVAVAIANEQFTFLDINVEVNIHEGISRRLITDVAVRQQQSTTQDESPGLSTTLIAFLGLLGKHQFLNVAMCDVDVNPYLIMAVKITSCIGTTTEIGEYFYTFEEARSGMTASVGSKGMVLRDVAILIIRKIQSQQSTLSRRDILLLKNSTNQIAQPRGSLAEYIRGLPLELCKCCDSNDEIQCATITKLQHTLNAATNC